MSNTNFIVDIDKLLSMNYRDAVQFLLRKYGVATVPYFPQKSYDKFLSGINKTLTKSSKVTRTKEGLYCHHIAEINYIMLSNSDFIKFFNYPFELQEKDMLVYCNLVEHSILHTLISREATGAQGQGGYWNFIRPMIIDWYIDENILNPEWMKLCYKASYLTKEEATNFINKCDKLTPNIEDETKK